MRPLLHLAPNVITDIGPLFLYYCWVRNVITVGTLILLGCKCYYRYDLYYTLVQLLHLCLLLACFTVKYLIRITILPLMFNLFKNSSKFQEKIRLHCRDRFFFAVIILLYDLRFCCSIHFHLTPLY